MIDRTKYFHLIFLIILELCVHTQMTVREGFIQSNNNLNYLVDVDDISKIHKGFNSDVRSANIYDSVGNSWLRFEPEFLDFKERPLGVPYLEKVTLYNVNSNKCIDMTSISGNTVHFHSSFFEDKVIPPLGNTTFNVVFLGREEGDVESSLFIHTKEGTFKYQVKGSSVASPYRLRPIIDIRVPLNVSFSPLIYMHNPHTFPIQVSEVYSSGGDFHLELPTGELEGPKDMWEILPFETKPVIRVRFNAKIENNYTAYVRIKLSNINDILVVPLEVEVTSQHNLFTSQGHIDFGIGGTLDKPKNLKLFIRTSTHNKPIKIHTISTTSKAIKINFTNKKLVANKNEEIEIADLILDWKIAMENKDFYGKISISYGVQKILEIPYYLTVVDGGLIFNESLTKYLVNGDPLDTKPREFSVHNKYKIPLAVMNASIPKEAQQYLILKKFKQVILKPNETLTLFTLTLKTNQINLNFDYNLEINTNITNLKISLQTYDGKLSLILPTHFGQNNINSQSCKGDNCGQKNVVNDQIFDLGLVSADSQNEGYFLLKNANPIAMEILNFGTSTSFCKVSYVKKGENNEKMDIFNPVEDVQGEERLRKRVLGVGEYGVFKISVDMKNREGSFNFQVNVQSKIEVITVMVKLKVSQGHLEVSTDKLNFENCFPGKICSHPLKIISTFNEPMVIESIDPIPADLRLTSSHLSHITSRSTKVVGHLYLNPALSCISRQTQANLCYASFPLSPEILKNFQYSKITDFDYNILTNLFSRYQNLTKYENITLKLETSEVKSYFFKSKIHLTWPKIVIINSQSSQSPQNSQNGPNSPQILNLVKFPLTQIGQFSFQNITVKNPSDKILALQLFMDFPSIRNVEKILPNSFFPAPEENFNSTAFFFLENRTFPHRKNFENELKIIPSKNSIPILLKPRESADVIVGFKATVSSLKSAIMYIRNNLTMIEILKIQGQGASPNFKFGNRKPGSHLPLFFELTEKHLKDCEKEKNRKNPLPNLTVKRSFTARNSGDLPIFINSFSINGYPCEGYGFKVLNCAPIELAPNSTKKIEIAFTPDFTLSKIQRTLILDTSLDMPVNYTLITTLPPYFMNSCSNVIARPYWEPLLYYTTAILMSFLLFIIISVIFIESDRILRQNLLIISQNSEVQTLDLRLIGKQTQKEFQTFEKTKILSSGSQKHPNWSCNDPIEKTKNFENLAPSTQLGSPGTQKGPTPRENFDLIIPSQLTRAQKKKVSKKNSLDSQFDSKKCKSIEKGPKEPKKTPREPKKVPKKIRTSIEAVGFFSEEETSSTTTESSNNEEGDKAPNLIVLGAQKVEKVSSKSPLKRSKSTNSTLETWSEPLDIYEKKLDIKIEKMTEDRVNKKMDLKGAQKVPKEWQKPKKRPQNNENKNLAKKDENKIENRQTPPLIPSSNIWTKSENRLTFSDVVAQNSQSLFTQTTSKIQNQKPTLYVEPLNKVKKGDLGPIGSKKCITTSNTSFNNQHHVLKNCLSFFSEPNKNNLLVGSQGSLVESSQNTFPTNTTQENNKISPSSLLTSNEPISQNIFLTNSSESVSPNSYFDLDIINSDIWGANVTKSTNLINENDFLQHEELPTSLSPVQANLNYNHFWEPLCAPVGDLNQPQTSMSSSSNDFYWSTPWSSNPWSPQISTPANDRLEGNNSTGLLNTGLPIRTPPGFNNCNPTVDPDRQERLQGNFDPFKSWNNIWQPPNSYWNPSSPSNNSSSSPNQ